MKDFSIYVGNIDRDYVRMLIKHGEKLGYEEHRGNCHHTSFDDCAFLRFTKVCKLIYYNNNLRYDSEEISIVEFLSMTPDTKLKVDSLNYEVELFSNGVKVGCQLITYDDMEKISEFVQKNKRKVTEKYIAVDCDGAPF